MNWVQTGASVLSAVVGGFVGGWVVAFRMGRWRQRIEDHLQNIEKRLEKGDPHVDAVPVLRAQIETVLQEIREIKEDMRTDRAQFVSHEECDRRHGDGAG